MGWGCARESSLAVGIGKSGAEGRQKARLGFPHAAPRARRLDSQAPGCAQATTACQPFLFLTGGSEGLLLRDGSTCCVLSSSGL